MDRAFETVMEEVMALDRDAQITIAEKIMAKVSDTVEHDAAWRAEIRRRTEGFRRGEIKTVDSTEVMAKVRRKVEEARLSA